MTAASSEEVRIEALSRGADEFISKPFVTEHLLASIQYLLSVGEGDNAPGTRVIAGDLEIDLAERTVRRGGQRIALTRSEWTLIEELTRQRGQPQLHQEILSRVWGSEYQNDTDYLALWVRRLRAKLGDDDAAPRIIVPYLDIGYRLNVRLPREESDGS
jgi:two-component system KDP operon response regulator KdpE